MNYSVKKGFTLIELLVVIAIIGILSAVVIASLNSARNKALNTSIRSNLINLRSQAEIFYNDNNGFYDNVCLNVKIREALDAAGNAATGIPADGVCNSDSISWAVSAPLRVPESDGSTYWCVDYRGTSKGETVALGTDLVCA